MPTRHTLSSGPYRPRIPTAHKESQRATYAPQLFAPSTGGTFLLSILLVILLFILLVILHAYHQRRNACTVHPGRIATNVHTIRQRLQLMRRQFPQTIHATNATPADNKRRQRFNHDRPAAALDTFANDPTTQGQTQRLQQIRPPGSYQPPQLAPTGQRFPAFPPDICGRSRPRVPSLLHARLHNYARLYEFLHISNENYIPYPTCARKPLILPGFKACTLCIRRQKVFTLDNRARKALILLHFRALHNQPICAKITIYHYINSNLCGNML